MKKTIICLLALSAAIMLLLLPAAVSADTKTAPGPDAGLYPSVPAALPAGRAVTLPVTVAAKSLPGAEGVRLFWKTSGTVYNEAATVKDDGSVRTYGNGGGTLSSAVFRAQVPASGLTAGSVLNWYFESDGVRSAVCTADITGQTTVSEMLITEIYCNTSGVRSKTYIELTNISDSPLELYDYKLGSTTAPVLDASLTLFLSDVRGKYILPAGGSALVWLIRPETYSADSTPDISYFTAKCKADNQKFALPAGTVTIPIDTASLINGIRVINARHLSLDPVTFNRLFLIRRGEFSSDAVCVAEIN